jgi:hypothetical protein
MSPLITLLALQTSDEPGFASAGLLSAFGPQTGVVTLVKAYWAGSLTMALNSE